MSNNYSAVPLQLAASGGAVEGDCTDTLFINYGDGASPPVGATLIVDDMVRIQPGQTYEISGLNGEIDKTKHRFRWDTTASAIINGVVIRRLML